MIKKYKEFVEEGFMKTVSQIANGDVVRDEDKQTSIIMDFMKNHKITDYTINKDFTVDVNDGVIIKREDVVNGKLPFKFGKVSGHFDCFYAHLKSLEGCPIEVGGDFNCSMNNLTSLEGCPQKVDGSFLCFDNNKTFTKKEIKSLCNIRGNIENK